MLRRGGVFARMLPDQKKQLVESLQKFGLCAAMCGDGSEFHFFRAIFTPFYKKYK